MQQICRTIFYVLLPDSHLFKILCIAHPQDPQDHPQDYSTVQVLICLSRYLDQETAKWPFRSSNQAATCYY